MGGSRVADSKVWMVFMGCIALQIIDQVTCNAAALENGRKRAVSTHMVYSATSCSVERWRDLEGPMCFYCFIPEDF